MPIFALFVAISAFFITPDQSIDEAKPPNNYSVYQGAVKAEVIMPSEVIEIKEKPKGVVGNGQCVDYVKARLGYAEQEWISAKNFYEHYEKFSFNSIPEPIRGSLVVTSEGSAWHIAFVEQVNESTIKISEQNYIKRQYGERILPKDYGEIRGYFVWDN